MATDLNVVNSKSRARANQKLSADEQRIISAYRANNDEAQRFLVEYIESVAKLPSCARVVPPATKAPVLRLVTGGAA